VNSILWDNKAPDGKEIRLGSGKLYIDFSDVQGGQLHVHVEPGSTLEWGEGMIDADPLFVDPSAHDYRLTQSPCNPLVENPCVHAGDPDSDWVKGSTRIDGVQDEGVMDLGFHYPEKYHDQDKQYHDPEDMWKLYYDDWNGNDFHDPGEPCSPHSGEKIRDDSTCWMCAASNVLSFEGFGYHYPHWIQYGGAPSPGYHLWTNNGVKAGLAGTWA
jgi:hypothetical protein